MQAEHWIYIALGGIAAFIVVKLVLFGLRKLALVLVVVAGMVLGSMYWSRSHDAAQQDAPTLERDDRHGTDRAAGQRSRRKVERATR
jgi:hypothetical protein